VSKFDRYLFCKDINGILMRKYNLQRILIFFGRLDFVGIPLFGSSLFFYQLWSPLTPSTMEKPLFRAGGNLLMGNSLAADRFLRQAIPVRAAKLVARVAGASGGSGCFSTALQSYLCQFL
jgi:hypothetical protein